MSLAEFQSQFKDLMFDHPDALKNAPAPLAAQFDTGDIALHERLGVYRNNIVGALSDVVVKSFPLLQALVGKDFLRGMAREFVLRTPPTEGCLNHYGAGFDNFIRGFKPAEKLPYLADMARLELAVNDAYYAADDTALTVDVLGTIAPEALGDLVLPLRHSAQLIHSDYPVMAIRHSCLNPDDDMAVDMAQGSYVMVHRPVFEVTYTALKEDEYAMLLALHKQATLGDAAEYVLTHSPNFDFQAFLQKHIALETFRALEPNS